MLSLQKGYPRINVLGDTLCRILLLIAVLAGAPAVNAQADRKFALLIGIGNYPPDGGWKPIHAQNDLLLMSDALQRRGFLSENIFTLTDQAATREGILQAWKKELLARIKPGDVVYFHFSGHGQQVADNNGDELDGYDEAIVPYDSPQAYKAGVNEGEKLIRDDELNRMYTDLRRRLGPKGNLMVVVDACHSGTSTRGMGPARGTIVQMASPEYNLAAAKEPGKAFDAPQLDSLPADTGRLAPMAAFFGSAHNQLNFETQSEDGRFVGPLTYALSRKLCQAQSPKTYRGLFEQVRIEMSATATRQQPQAEGTLDQELLGGRLLEPAAYFRVLRWNDPGSVVVDAGWVQGLNEGAVLGLYPAETRDPDQTVAPLARGTVTAVSPVEATLRLDADLQQPVARQAWAYVLEQNLGDLRLGLSLQLPEQHPVRAALLEKIARYPIIHLDGTPDLFLIQAGAGIHLIGPGDLVLDSLSGALPPARTADSLMRRMMGFAQAKYLRRMDAQSESLRVGFELVPVRRNPENRARLDTIPIQSKYDAAGILHFQNLDSFKIRVTNYGDKAAYFTIIDIQPDNVINVIFPDPTEAPNERVRPGQTIELRNCFQVGPPAGVEMFKLIATDKPIDLRPLVKSRGAATRANANPLEKLIGQTYFNDDCVRLRGQTPNLNTGAVHVHSFTFTID
jgi:hypothetical protein